ncbi:hypothetical protein F0562_022341 [Nyssa sinensis]|uniref:Late embryogenesis abundant protein LEA-2 subgroup domain-containing protein n=1 Tax=Nyssa sinensis TaxID=561372 RepID=A0A5J5BQD6_9ASTE|nr:hypothetical protein F0562_022341 [Nyssa sinensis]
MGDQSNSRPVTGYPATGYPQPQSNTNPNCYPSAHPTYSTTTTTAGTAYPYAAPPPQTTYYNPNPYYGQNYTNPRATFLRRLFAILIASFIITGTVVFIIWLVLRPRLPEFRVDSVSLSNFNVSPSSQITGNWDVRFTVRNPNHKITLYYDRIEASVYYKSQPLSDTTMPPFVQDTKNETAVRATFAASSTYVDGWVVNAINQDRTRGRVGFNVRLFSRVRFKAGAWRARRRFLRVYCPDLNVGITSNNAGGTLVSGSRQCRVGI